MNQKLDKKKRSLIREMTLIKLKNICSRQVDRMTLIAAKWTIDEYHRIVAAVILCDRKVELLRGEIVEMPPEREPHAYCSDEAGEYLTKLLAECAKIRHAKPITLHNNSEPEAGITEYWVVNLKKSHLVVFREPLDGDYATKSTLTAGVIQPLAFPDISVSIEQIINQ